MGVVYAVNPASSKRRKSKRKFSAKQLAAQRRFAAMARSRSKGAKRKTSRRTVHRNPAPHHRKAARRHASYSRRASRRVRRNPSASSIRLTVKSLMNTALDAAVGGAGAIGVDLAMGQAIKFLPVSMIARYKADGTLNWGYYLAKLGIAVGVGVAGHAVLPGKFKRYATQMAQGSLTVQAYEIGKSMIPAEWAMGYYSPAAVSAIPANMTGNDGSMPRPQLGYYESLNGDRSTMPVSNGSTVTPIGARRRIG